MTLTARELEVLRALTRDDPKVAAHRLGIAHRTLTVHRSNAYRKLGVHSLAGAYRQLGWLRLPDEG